MYALLIERAEERASRAYPLAATQEQRLPPAPRLQQFPTTSSTSSASEKRALLEGYGWMNKEAGIVHIPIEEAMRLMVERGLPSRAPQDGQALETPGLMPVGRERRARHGAATTVTRLRGACTRHTAQSVTQCVLGLELWALGLVPCPTCGCAAGLPERATATRSAPGTVSTDAAPQLKDVSFKQRLNEMLPLDAAFTDETGRRGHAR